MPCFHPLRAFRSSEVHEKSGKHKIIFNPDSRKALIERAAGFDAALRSVHRLSLRQGAGDGPALRSRAEDARGELFLP